MIPQTPLPLTRFASLRRRAAGVMPLLGVAALIAGFAGCDSKPRGSQFVLSDKTLELMPEARQYVDQKLEEDFGTPQELVAWLRFPIDYGRRSGKISEVEATEKGAYKFTVEWDGESDDDELRRGVGVIMTSGAYAGQGVKMNHYDPATGRLHVDAFMDPPPETGDELQVVGSKLQLGRMAYMEHCVHCHGTSGDGNGPTAKYLNPPPRDYRLGKFKFTTTKQPEKISSEDLTRTVKHGIPGTYMPSFMLLPDDELTAVVEYVRWLAIRGEMEKRMGDELGFDYSQEAIRDREEGGESEDDIIAELNAMLEEDFPETVDDIATGLAEEWERADDEEALIIPSVPRVENTAESRARGKDLYLSAKTKCVTCHGPTGRGNGSATDDFWPIPGSQPPVLFEVRGLHDDWGNPIAPRDLTQGIYRGGRRPIDVFCRIYAGIKGTQMPAFGGTALKDEEIWDLVNYVLSMPYETDRTIAEPLEAAPLDQATAATE